MTSFVLLLISLFCLGSWIITLRLAGKRWRFELFAIDFALGTMVFSLLTAFTFGNSATDLSFSDHLLLASKTSQALIFVAGFTFGLANFLLLGAVSLLGIAGGFPVCVGWGLLVNAVLNFRSYRPGTLFIGLVLLTLGVLLDIRAWRFRISVPVAAPRKNLSQSSGTQGTQSLKGLIVSLFGGTLLAVAYSMASGGIYGDLGLGAYGSLLFFCVGILISTLVFSIVFFNISLEGAPLNLRSYFGGKLRQHLLGLLGGVLWAIGILTAFLKEPTVTATGWQEMLAGFLPFGAALLAILWGALVFKEFAVSLKAQLSLAGTVVLLISSFLLINSAYVR